MDHTIHEAARLAEEQERSAQAEGGGAYTHAPGRPLQWEGRTYEVLTFQWDALTGADHLEVESELLARGRTLVVPEYTGDYLCGMAARACTERDEKGRRVLSAAALKKLPLKDFTAICRSLRSFLLRRGSPPETAGGDSENGV